MANEFVMRVWRPGIRAPSENGITIATSVALDRELLGVFDGTISRTPNAPKLTPLSPSILELQVPERSARPVLVIEGFRFEGLQHAISCYDICVPWANTRKRRRASGTVGSRSTVFLATLRRRHGSAWPASAKRNGAKSAATQSECTRTWAASEPLRWEIGSISRARALRQGVVAFAD